MSAQEMRLRSCCLPEHAPSLLPTRNTAPLPLEPLGALQQQVLHCTALHLSACLHKLRGKRRETYSGATRFDLVWDTDYTDWDYFCGLLQTLQGNSFRIPDSHT
jgi:hypothetical protein